MVDAPITAPASGTEPAPAPAPGVSPVVAGRYEVARAAELCALLQKRPPVFPSAPGDPVQPLALGILEALAPLARPETTPEQLKQALRRYCVGLSYLLAQARPGSLRHDLAGHPVAPVSEEHRRGARTRFKGVRTHRDRIQAARRAAAAAQEAATAAPVDAAPAAAISPPA